MCECWLSARMRVCVFACVHVCMIVCMYERVCGLDGNGVLVYRSKCDKTVCRRLDTIFLRPQYPVSDQNSSQYSPPQRSAQFSVFVMRHREWPTVTRTTTKHTTKNTTDQHSTRFISSRSSTNRPTNQTYRRRVNETKKKEDEEKKTRNYQMCKQTCTFRFCWFVGIAEFQYSISISISMAHNNVANCVMGFWKSGGGKPFNWLDANSQHSNISGFPDGKINLRRSDWRSDRAQRAKRFQNKNRIVREWVLGWEIPIGVRCRAGDLRKRDCVGSLVHVALARIYQEYLR